MIRHINIKIKVPKGATHYSIENENVVDFWKVNIRNNLIWNKWDKLWVKSNGYEKASPNVLNKLWEVGASE